MLVNVVSVYLILVRSRKSGVGGAGGQHVAQLRAQGLVGVGGGNAGGGHGERDHGLHCVCLLLRYASSLRRSTAKLRLISYSYRIFDEVFV